VATLNIKNFPEGLYGKLRSLAETEHRSLAQQVIHLLGQAVEEQEPRSLLELKGMGKECWEGIDAARHVEEERAAWD
jgi:plasmid stability protein